MGKEMTRYAFISYMEDFMRQLLNCPLKAKVHPFLSDNGIDSPKAIKILTMKTDPNDENSAVIIKKEKIKDNGFDENGKRLKDTFDIEYKIPRKDYTKKMRNLYINLFESNIVDGCPIEEEDGATCAADCNNSAPVQPLFGPIRRKTIYITQEQAEHLKNQIDEMAETDAGDFQYDVPFGNKNSDFYKEANNHKDMMKNSWKNDNH